MRNLGPLLILFILFAIVPKEVHAQVIFEEPEKTEDESKSAEEEKETDEEARKLIKDIEDAVATQQRALAILDEQKRSCRPVAVDNPWKTYPSETTAGIVKKYTSKSGHIGNSKNTILEKDGTYNPSDMTNDYGHHILSKTIVEADTEGFDTSGFIWSEDGDDHFILVKPSVFSDVKVGQMCVFVSALGTEAEKHRPRCKHTAGEADHKPEDHCAWSVHGMGSRNWRVKCDGHFTITLNAPKTTGSRSAAIALNARIPTERNIRVSMDMQDQKTVKRVTTRTLSVGISISGENAESRDLSVQSNKDGESGTAGIKTAHVVKPTVNASAGESETTEVVENVGIAQVLNWSYTDSRTFFTLCHGEGKREEKLTQGATGVILINTKADDQSSDDNMCKVSYTANVSLRVVAIDSQEFTYCFLGDRYMPNKMYGTDPNNGSIEKDVSKESIREEAK